MSGGVPVNCAQSAPMKIKFIWVGKTKNVSLRALLSDYQERIGRWAPCEIIEARDASREKTLPAGELVAKEAEELARHIPERGKLVALDERGSPLTSSGFARWLEFEQNNGAPAVTFVIGGPEGLSEKISGRAHLMLSMGKMTWTHDMCRVLLLEQVYRALCIIHRIPYHKGN
jgi:23S rRNA (pseudouridine1915-N3)-methyltransferase